MCKHIRLIIILSLFSLFSCQSGSVLFDSGELNDRLLQDERSSELLHFNSAEALSNAILNWTGKETTRSESETSFVSYADAVMSEPGYEDCPWAIFSKAFGSFLNRDGEVVFGSVFLKLGRWGILVGPESKTELIRTVMENENLLDLLGDMVPCPYVNEEEFVYEIIGNDGVYFCDTFNYLEASSTHDRTMEDMPLTRATDIYVKPFNRDAVGLFRAGLDWDASFTVPSSGDQKRKFSDGKHCNDTKIYHQKYIVASDTGLKTKNMKKSGLFWNKTEGDIEAGIIGTIIHEDAEFGKYFSGFDVNPSVYAGVTYVIASVPAYNMSINSIISMSNSTLLAKINNANKEALKCGYNVSVQGIRFVVNDDEAFTRIPDIVKMGNMEIAELNFPMKFGGQLGILGSLLESSNMKSCPGQYHIFGQVLYGASTRGNEIRGSKMVYTYLPVSE